jgi:single-stranded-DNA-specific exonuclease
MPQRLKRWEVKPSITPEASRELQDFPPAFQQILYNRGQSTQVLASRYINAEPPVGSSSANLRGLPEAVDRIIWGLNNNESIVIYGDYDVDGVTSTALLCQVLERLGAQVSYYIPNRFDEGYGVNIEALDSIKALQTDLVITVDCGIRSFVEIEHANRLGLDVIISDHHHPKGHMPRAYAVINPKQEGDQYPDKDLAGVGLAYKLAAAIIERIEQTNRSSKLSIEPEGLLDLVALGTIADIAPLVHENRALVRSGLGIIKRMGRQGLNALIGVSGLRPDRIKASHIGYTLGPRLNAAGRLESALDALNLLTTDDINKAVSLAQKLDNQNQKRQKLTQETQYIAEQLAFIGDPDPLLLFAAHEDFNPGIIGLAASKLTEMYYRPSIVAQIGPHETRGSCRSIPEFHITMALDQCSDLLKRHGGHAAAAGFTVINENLPALVERLQSIAVHELAHKDLRPILSADMEIPLRDLRPELLQYLEMLQPTGYGNQEATFISRDLQVKYARSVGKEGNHLKMAVSDGWVTYDAIAFRQGHWLEDLPERIDLMYSFEVNEYNGRVSLQLNVQDLKPTGTPDI